MTTPPTWPDSQTCWRNKGVIVTCGSGFFGVFVVDALHARSVAGMLTLRRQRLEH